MALRFVFTAIVLLTWIVIPNFAHAAKYDLFLWRFCERDGSTGDPLYGYCVPYPASDPAKSSLMKPDNDKFGKFARQFAAVLSPKYHSPAETLGWSGWNLGFEFSVNDIPGGEQWDDALQGVERFKNKPEYSTSTKAEGAPGLYNTIQFHARKGLPYSFEVGATMTYVLHSEMYAVGVEGKFAFFEGFEYIPDMAVRMNYSHLFGAPDLDLDIFGWDFSVSKNFGLGGFIQLCPYTGYSLVYALIDPHVTNPSFNAENNDRLLLLDSRNELIHRWFIGLRIIATYVSFTPEIIVTNVDVYNYSFNLGADF